MKKSEKEEYIVYDKDKKRMKSYRIGELPISKEIIVEKSIYFFDDPNPCFIHANAVIIRLSEEIKKYLKGKQEPIFICTLPKEIMGYLNLGKEVCFIQYCSYNMR